MSVDDIKTDIDELYGVDISPAMISKITDKIWTRLSPGRIGC